MFAWTHENMAVILFGVLGLILLIVGGTLTYNSDGTDSTDTTLYISFTTIGTIFLVVSLVMFARNYYYSEERVAGRRTRADERDRKESEKHQDEMIGLKKHR